MADEQIEELIARAVNMADLAETLTIQAYECNSTEQATVRAATAQAAAITSLALLATAMVRDGLDA